VMVDFACTTVLLLFSCGLFSLEWNSCINSI
jgi:hypothetical protein